MIHSGSHIDEDSNTKSSCDREKQTSKLQRNIHGTFSLSLGDKDGSKVTTVAATPGQGPDRPQEVSYTDTKVIGNGSFGVVYQAKLCNTGELVAIKKVLQDKRFKVRMCVVGCVFTCISSDFLRKRS